MEFPNEWVVLEMEDFETASPRELSELGMEIMAQVRSSGRIMDHFRIALGGSRTLKPSFAARELFTSSSTPAMTLTWETWPRDIVIRRNMATSEWIDVINLVAANEMMASTPDKPESNAEFMAVVNKQSGKTSFGASIRWAVGVGPDKRMELTLQGLPGTATYLAGKPTLQG